MPRITLDATLLSKAAHERQAAGVRFAWPGRALRH